MRRLVAWAVLLAMPFHALTGIYLRAFRFSASFAY